MRLSLFQPTEPIVLRPYQNQAVEDLRNSIRRGNKRVILQAGTGSGKTVIAAEIIKSAVRKERNILFLAHRRELIDQCSDKLKSFGVDHGIIMAGRKRNQIARVQVASVQTLWSRAVQRSLMGFPATDLVVLDECHRTLAPTYLKILEGYPDAIVLGLSATPIRSDGRGLGEVYSDMVSCPGVRELTKEGFLVPVRYYAPSMPDLSGVKIRMGDYVEGQLEERMDKEPLIGNIVETWGRLAEDRKTVVFATGVKHSIHLAEAFTKAGVRAAHLDGKTDKHEREKILFDLYKGHLQVLSNCMVLVEGWDCPPVSCCVLARPTRFVGLYLQMAGRTLRPWQDKDDCLLIDHSGAIYDHGFVDEAMPWDLNPEEKIQERIRDKEKKKRTSKPITCPECKLVFISKPACPNCGWKPEPTGKEYTWVDGKIVEVTPDGTKEFKYSQEMKLSWFRQLKGYALDKGYKNGWVSHTFYKKFGHWPQFRYGATPVQPGPEVMGYVRSRLIAWAKRKEKEKNAGTQNQDS